MSRRCFRSRLSFTAATCLPSDLQSSSSSSSSSPPPPSLSLSSWSSSGDLIIKESKGIISLLSHSIKLRLSLVKLCHQTQDNHLIVIGMMVITVMMIMNSNSTYDESLIMLCNQIQDNHLIGIGIIQGMVNDHWS